MRKRTKPARSRIIRKWDGTLPSEGVPANENVTHADDEVEEQPSKSHEEGLQFELENDARMLESQD